jgi:CopG family nickel-responsive transcriptional regulator
LRPRESVRNVTQVYRSPGPFTTRPFVLRCASKVSRRKAERSAMPTRSRTARFGVSLEDRLLKRFDGVIARKGYANRSEAIRDLIRDSLVMEEWGDEGTETVATLTLVYDHGTHELTEKLTDLQHSFHEHVISAVHVHLDAHNCLEVLILRGKSGEIRRHAELLASVKGVKHGKLTMTSTGKQI